ncbi:O-antigen polymerase [Vibrio splendidus]
MFKFSSLILAILSIVLSILIGIVSDNAVWTIVGTLLVSIYVIFLSGLSPTNPLVWYTFFINIYHLGICILYFIGFRSVSNVDGIIIVNALSILGFLISSLLIFKRKESFSNMYTVSFSQISLNLSLVIMLLGSLLVPFLFIASGASSKAEFSNSFGSVFGMLNVVIAMFLVKSEKKPTLIIILLSIYILFVTLLLGERNILLSFSILLMIILYSKFAWSLKRILSITLLLLLLIPILGVYKNIFTRSSFDGEASTNNSAIIGLLNGEFRSAGYNIERILSSKEQLDYKYGMSIFNDAIRSVVPGFVYKVENSISWYNNNYHSAVVAQGRGYGFSLAAEGYINFGYFGVVVWFVISGLIINILYIKSMSSGIYLVVYASTIPVFIYSLRGDFSTIFSPMLKQVMFTIIFVALIDSFIKKCARR